MPNVTGKTQSDAESAIKGAGLVPVVYKGSSSSVASGKVYGQVPSAGSKVEKGSEVGIFVSTGPAPTTSTAVSVPNVVGKSEADAQSALQAAGLVGVKYTGYSSTVAKGMVIQQLPAAGSKVDKGTQVGYQVSLGKPPTSAPSVKVPNVVGMTSAAATKALTDAGLKPIVVEDWDETVAEDKVIAQLPDPGVSVAPGSSVAVSVSKGPQPVPTPY